MHGTERRGARLRNEAGKIFETLEDIDFSKVDTSNSDFVRVSNRDQQTKEPTSFALKVSGVSVKAGETKETTFSVGAYEKFLTLTLPDEDVIEVIEVRDSEGNDWQEVDYLAQDTVFKSEPNNSSDSSDVPYVLTLKSVPHRFVTEFDIETNKTSLVFGTGDSSTFDGELIPDVGDLSLPVYGKDTFTDFSIDPRNFLKTRTLGLAPTNTTLTVKYRVGGGRDTNTGATLLNEVVSGDFEVGDTSLNSEIIQDVGNSFSVENPEPIQRRQRRIQCRRN